MAELLPEIPSSLLTVDQVASWLNISKRSVYSLMHTGQLTSVKIGGLRRIELTVVEAFLDECRKRSA